MSDPDSLKELLHAGLALARQRVADDGGFSAFGVVLANNGYNIIETVEVDDGDLNDVLEFLRERAAQANADAFILCVNGSVYLSEEKVTMNTIKVVLEGAGRRMNAYQLYGKNIEGEWVFAPLEEEPG